MKVEQFIKLLKKLPQKAIIVHGNSSFYRSDIYGKDTYKNVFLSDIFTESEIEGKKTVILWGDE